MADPRQAALPVAVLDDAQDEEILPTATSTRTRTRSAHVPVDDDTKLGEDDEKPSGSTSKYVAQDEDVTALPPEEEQEENYRRDGGRKAWSTVVAGFLFMFICLGQLNSFGIFQAHYKFVTFPAASELSISFVGSTATGTMIIGNLLAGRPCEVYGIRPVAFAGLFFTLVGLIGASFCNSIPALIATQGILQGLGSGFLLVAGAIAPVAWFRKRRSFAMGIVASGSGVGGLAFSYLLQATIDAYGYHWALRISAFVTTAVIGIALCLMHIAPNSHKRAKAGSFRKTLVIFKTEKWLIACYASFLIFCIPFYVPTFYLVPYLQTQAGASSSKGATISAVLSAGNIVGRVGLGYMADRKFGRLPGLGIMNVFTISLVVAALLTLAVWLPSGGNESAAFAYAFLYGVFGLASIGISPAVLARHLDPDKLPSIAGVFFTSELPGFLAGAPISGAILARTSYRVTIAYAGATMLLGALFSIAARFMISPKFFVKV